jgi:hypothetical protein
VLQSPPGGQPPRWVVSQECLSSKGRQKTGKRTRQLLNQWDEHRRLRTHTASWSDCWVENMKEERRPVSHFLLHFF